jgi:transketolase C-terminal domain/subunit
VSFLPPPLAIRDLVVQALVAAETLATKGLSVRVTDCHTLKPLDIETVRRAAEESEAIVTAENNVYYGGLGSAVAEVLVKNYPIPMERIGICDTFAESGPYLDSSRSTASLLSTLPAPWKRWSAARTACAGESSQIQENDCF